MFTCLGVRVGVHMGTLVHDRCGVQGTTSGVVLQAPPTFCLK